MACFCPRLSESKKHTLLQMCVFGRRRNESCLISFNPLYAKGKQFKQVTKGVIQKMFSRRISQNTIMIDASDNGIKENTN